jgi:hypothetical protein
MKTSKLLLSIVVLLAVSFFSSCTKDDTTTTTPKPTPTPTGKQKVLAQVVSLEPGDSSFMAFEYNAAKKVSKIISKDSKQAITEIQTFSYDASGKLLNSKTYSDAAMTMLTGTVTLTYSGTLLTSAVDMNENDTTQYTYSFSNSKLAVIEATTYEGKTKTTFTWTSLNITKAETSFDSLNGAGYSAIYYTTYTYDAKVNPMAYFNLIMNDNVSMLSKNNYLKASVFDNNNMPMGIISCVYTYDGDYPKSVDIDYGFGNVIQKFSYIEI